MLADGPAENVKDRESGAAVVVANTAVEPQVYLADNDDLQASPIPFRLHKEKGEDRGA
jgi:hypothetical protein